MKSTIFILAALFLTVVGHDGDRGHYCNKELENKVNAVCREIWYSADREKRAINEAMPDEAAKAYLSHKRNRLRRSSDGLHEECCNEHCSVEEIYEYC